MVARQLIEHILFNFYWQHNACNPNSSLVPLQWSKTLYIHRLQVYMHTYKTKPNFFMWRHRVHDPFSDVIRINTRMTSTTPACSKFTKSLEISVMNCMSGFKNIPLSEQTIIDRLHYLLNDPRIYFLCKKSSLSWMGQCTNFM